MNHYVMLVEYANLAQGNFVVMHTGNGPVTATKENRHLLENIAIELIRDGLINAYQLAYVESRVVRSGDLPLFTENLLGPLGPTV